MHFKIQGVTGLLCCHCNVSSCVYIRSLFTFNFFPPIFKRITSAVMTLLSNIFCMHHKRCAAVSSPVTCSCNSMLKLSTRLRQQLSRQRAVLSVRTSFLRAFVLVLGLFFRGSGPLDFKLLRTLRHFFLPPGSKHSAILLL